MTMRRATLLTLLLLLAALIIPAGTALAQPGGSASTAAAASAASDFDNDGITDLAVGAPAEDIGNSTFNAGAMSAGGQLFTQNSPGVPGTAEDFDSFGGNAFNAG
jgi:hypothetical protein